MSKSFYRWHRLLSIIVAIPVLLWAISGFMHPIMSSVRPAVRLQQLPVKKLNDSAIWISPAEALTRNNIAQVHDLRLVHIGPNTFFQVQLQRGDVPVYLSTMDGALLRNGDDLYARHIARQFLEGVDSTNSPGLPEHMGEASGHACCTSATRWVMDIPKGAMIRSVERLTAFNEEYDEIQRILPAYRVSFDRADGIRIYVETTQDRFVHAVDDRRAALDAVFGMFHTWDWAASLGGFRYVLMALLLSISFVSAVMGLWIFRMTRTIRPNGNPRLRWRFNHRIVSVTASVFTLMFSFSGAYHALSKLSPDDRIMYHVDNDISVAELETDPLEMGRKGGIFPYNYSLVRLQDSTCWRILSTPSGKTIAGDSRPVWSKDRKAVMPVVDYFTSTGQRLVAGERKYAAYLGSLFGGGNPSDTLQVQPVTAFAGEYGFVNKRLPVWRVEYAGEMDDRFYIETATGQLSVRVSDADLPEGYSFSFLHKHHFMDFGGKTARDLSTMIWAAMQVAMVVVGMLLYVKSARK